jgi:hypothetical protein
MKSYLLAAAILSIAAPVFADNVEDLRRQIAEKEAELRQLRARMHALERAAAMHQNDSVRASVDELPQDSTRALERALVRERGLLLSAGTKEVEANFVYTHEKDNASGFRRDSYGPGIAIRVGLPLRSQFELAVPYVFERRQDNLGATRDHGIGDAVASISHQFAIERGAMPALIGTLIYVSSTGRNTVFESNRPVALGSGFRAVQGSMTAVKRVDPLVFFGSYSYMHNYADTRGGVRVDPGNNHGLRIGTALAASPSTSLRAAFTGTFYDEARVGGVALRGSDDPVGMLELGASVTMSDSTALDVSVGAGVTHNAPDFRISVALPIRF